MWFERDTTSKSPTKPDTTAPSSSSPNDDETLKSTVRLRPAVEAFIVAYESPISPERSIALRDLCKDEAVYGSLGADGDDTSNGSSNSDKTVVQLGDNAEDEFAVLALGNGVYEVTSVTLIDIITDGKLEYTLHAAHRTNWQFVSEKWLLVAIDY